MTDIFGDWWDGSQIFEVLRVMDSHLSSHKFVVLTKNPEGMATALHIYRAAEGM